MIGAATELAVNERYSDRIYLLIYLFFDSRRLRRKSGVATTSTRAARIQPNNDSVSEERGGEGSSRARRSGVQERIEKRRVPAVIARTTRSHGGSERDTDRFS